MSVFFTNHALINQIFLQACHNDKAIATILYSLCIEDIVKNYSDGLKPKGFFRPLQHKFNASPVLKLRLSIIGHWLCALKQTDLPIAQAKLASKTIHEMVGMLNNREQSWVITTNRLRADTTAIAKTGDYHLHAMTSQLALHDEAWEMNSCLDNSVYMQSLRTEQHLYFSLRNQFNRSIATIQLDAATQNLTLFEGWKSTPHPFAPLPGMYWPIMHGFMKYMGWGNATPQHMTGLFDQDGDTYSIFHLPQGLTIKKSLSFSKPLDNFIPASLMFCGHDPEIAIPDNITVEGNLDLSGRHVTKIGYGFSADKLDLRATHIASLPSDLSARVLLLPDHISLHKDWAGAFPYVETISINGQTYRQKATMRRKPHTHGCRPPAQIL